MLPAKFEEPPGFQWGNFTSADGMQIRYGVLKRDIPPPKGTVVIAPGFREPIEKYFETAREMADRGFAVWIIDWPGQGGSERFLKNDPQKMYNKGYDGYLDTLHQFATTVVSKSAGPFVLTGHSMGAHISLRYLKEHAGVFDSAILTAAMLNIATGMLPRPVARQMAHFAKAFGYLEKYIPGGGIWTKKREEFKGNRKTSDPERFKILGELYEEKPDLRMGDPTYGWLYHTLQSVDILNDESYLKSIKTPILMEISGDEAIVDKGAEERASRLLPNCT
ncbi:MAG: alpha/beta hydrolase, partial [Proteobacteria bacterium]|nr:alpha/beta hydrolase [Pseudomonadota bacterium]